MVSKTKSEPTSSSSSSLLKSGEEIYKVNDFKLRPDVTKEEELSFEDQSLKLNTEEDAKDVADKIRTTKTVHILTFSGNTIGIEAAKALGKSLEVHPEFRRAHWKDMFTGRMKTEIPPALIHLSNGIMTAQAQLVELDLSDNAFGPIGMEGLKDLLRSPSCFTLKELKLNNTGCGVTGGKHLANLLHDCFDRSTKAGHPLALQVFILGRSRQENEGGKALASVFKKMGSLEQVVMPQNGIYHEGISALMDAFTNNPNLRILNMNDNTFTAKGAEALANALPSLQRLEVLNVGDCLLKSKGAQMICRALKKGHENLKELHMDSNEIQIKGGLEIIGAIANKPKLEKLVIDTNQFGESGVDRIMKKLQNVGKGDLIHEIQDDEEPDEEEEVFSDEEEEQKDNVEKSPANIFGGGTPSSAGIFGGASSASKNLFGGASKTIFDSPASSKGIFGGNSTKNKPLFGTPSSGNNASPSLFGGSASNASPFGGGGGTNKGGGLFGNTTPSTTGLFGKPDGEGKGIDLSESKNLPSFASISSGKNEDGDGSGGTSGFAFGKQDESFTFAGAGSSVFGGGRTPKGHATPNANQTDGGNGDDNEDNEHDPHFEPIIPLPELVQVTTGEEDETELFKYRSKVYRYDSETKQWKERGVGDIKILHHPSRNTYRVIQRRDQIHKIAINHLITKDIDLKPMASSETAVCYFAMDFAEDEAKLEQLAVKFKTTETKDQFKKIFLECQSKIGNSSTPIISRATLNEEDEDDDEEEEDYEEEDEEESDNTMFVRNCRLSEISKDSETKEFLAEVELRILYDDDVYGARITADDLSEETSICNHLIAIQTKLTVDNNKCCWSALDFSTDPPSYRTFEALFPTEEEAAEFRDIFYDGKDLAEQSDIFEKPPGGFDDDPEYYGEGRDDDES